MVKKTKKIISLLIITSLIVVCCACSDESAPLEYSGNHTIIFDTDSGADDAMALIMLAKAPNVDIRAVTVLAGNVPLEQGSKNALMSLEVAGSDNVPVYCGSTTRINGDEIIDFSVFGEDGMGDKDLIHPKKTVSDGDAVDQIIDTVAANEDTIEIVATGPLTNVAKAISKDPETMSHVKRIWAMGSGGLQMEGNASPGAEFNVYLDPEAYDIVFESGIPTTIVGLDVCESPGLLLTDEKREEIRSWGKTGEFISDSLSGIANYYKETNQGELCVCDPVVSTAMIWSDFAKTRKCFAHVILDSDVGRGVVFFFQKGVSNDVLNITEYNTDVVKSVEDNLYMQLLESILKDD